MVVVVHLKVVLAASAWLQPEKEQDAPENPGQMDIAGNTGVKS